MELGWHVTIRLRNDRVLAPTIADRRTFATTVLEIGRAHRLFACDAPDTHGHLAAACDREAAGRMARDVETALSKRLSLGASWEPARFTAIRDHWHLENTLDYVLSQQTRHGVGGDPGRESTNLPDLLGLRVVGRHTVGVVKELLPRLDRARLLRLLGVEAIDERFELGLLAEAAAAAIGLPGLVGRSEPVVDARAAAVAVALDRGVRQVDAAAALGVTPRSVRRLESRGRDPRLERAILLQMGLRASWPEEALFVEEQAGRYLPERTQVGFSG